MARRGLGGKMKKEYKSKLAKCIYMRYQLKGHINKVEIVIIYIVIETLAEYCQKLVPKNSIKIQMKFLITKKPKVGIFGWEKLLEFYWFGTLLEYAKDWVK